MWENNLTRPRDHVHAPEGARGPPGLTWINFNKYSITGVTRVCTRLHHRRCSGQRKHQPRTRRDRCDVWCDRKHHLWASTGLVMESWSQLLGLLGQFNFHLVATQKYDLGPAGQTARTLTKNGPRHVGKQFNKAQGPRTRTGRCTGTAGTNSVVC